MSPIPQWSRLPAQKGGWTGKRKNSERECYWEHLFASWRISTPTRGRVAAPRTGCFHAHGCSCRHAGAHVYWPANAWRKPTLCWITWSRLSKVCTAVWHLWSSTLPLWLKCLVVFAQHTQNGSICGGKENRFQQNTFSNSRWWPSCDVSRSLQLSFDAWRLA